MNLVSNQCKNDSLLISRAVGANSQSPFDLGRCPRLACIGPLALDRTGVTIRNWQPNLTNPNRVITLEVF
jgi:hypothetical protein